MAEHIFEHNDVQLAYSLFGSGPPLVLVHGFPFDHTMWTPQIVRLQASCKVIAPDLRGFGRSTLTDADRDQGVEMRQYADDVVAVLDKIGVTSPVILCGFSMGGYVLWQLASAYPDRVRALVLCDTRAGDDSDEARQGRLTMAEEVLQAGSSELVAEKLMPKLLAPDTRENDPSLVEQVEGMIRQVPPAAIAAAQRGMARRPDVRALLPQFDMPALLLGGTADAISSPEEMQAIAQQMPSAEFVEVPEAGHLTVLENPEAVNEAFADFITRLPS